MRRPFGQNFLVDESVAREIVASAALSADDTVLEIGPGKGVLSVLIAAQAGRLIAVELDRNLIPTLERKLSAFKNVELVNADFLSFRLPSNVSPPKAGQPGAGRFTVISNLPYNAATPIIERFLPLAVWKTAVVMVQKEVADRITAGPGGRDYGVLSIMCQYFCSPERLFDVAPSSFKPAPKVTSTVLRLENKLPPPPPNGFFKLVKAAFQQRRKTVLNSLSAATGIPKDTLSGQLTSCSIDPSLRPEKLTEKDYLCLTKMLENSIIS